MTTMAPRTFEAYRLLHEGSLALADIEDYGMRVDVDYIHKAKKKLTTQIERQERKLHKTRFVKKWQKKYGSKFNMDSPEQLSNMIYKVFKYARPKDGKSSVSAKALEKIDKPIVKEIIHLRRLKKTKNTYLDNYLREEVEGVIRAFFHLHTVVTYRSSSSKINFQNQPTRIPFIKRFVREAVIPRDGFMLGEIDYSGAEVTVAACYHEDKNMIKDILDPERDMHRDMAMRCFLLKKSQINKQIRYCGKNMFVFPQFYGDYYKTNAQDLWDAIGLLELKTNKGTPLKKHLKIKGITSFKKFEKHIQKVEHYFWSERYPEYAEWKDEHWDNYLDNGFVDIKTGFRCSGLMSRNDAINYPIQGAAFHCLLWSLIQINKWLKKNKMKTRIIGQIHDSIVFEFWPPEIEKVLNKVHHIMTKHIRNHYPWLIIPLEIEVELSPLDKSWFHKKEVKKQEFDCDCGNYWFYEKEDGGEKEWECPVCGEKYEQGHA